MMDFRWGTGGVWGLWAAKCTCPVPGSAELKRRTITLPFPLPCRVCLAKMVRQVEQAPQDLR